MPSILQLQRRAMCDRYDPDAYLELCQALVGSGQVAYAADIFDRWQRIDPDDPAIPYYRSILLQSQPPLRAPDDYLIHEFDGFADSYDWVLVRLGYNVPGRFGEILAGLPDLSSARVLDLGCGTGLCGAAARPYVSYLRGVDLSPRMLERARQREVYDELVHGEICSYLSRCEDLFDLVMAGDSLIYFGDLSGVLEGIGTVLQRGGRLLFSLELAADGHLHLLSSSGRFQHSRAYVEATLHDRGYTVVAVESRALRQENGLPVAGVILLAAYASEPGPLRLV